LFKGFKHASHHHLFDFPIVLLSQPHFWKSVKMALTLPKWGLGKSVGLPKLQSLITGVKTPRLEAFLISVKSYRSVDVELALHEPFGHLQHKL